MQPARSLCGGLSNGIGEQAAVRQSYKAAHTQSIKKDTRSAGKATIAGSRWQPSVHHALVYALPVHWGWGTGDRQRQLN
jgi:hypothetical protein